MIFVARDKEKEFGEHFLRFYKDLESVVLDLNMFLFFLFFFEYVYFFECSWISLFVFELLCLWCLSPYIFESLSE